MNDSTERLLVRPLPLGGPAYPEALASWLFRVARANAFENYSELLRNAGVTLSPNALLDVEPDRWALMPTLQRLSGSTRKQLLLHALDDSLVATTGSASGVSGRWLLSSRGRGSRFSFCPECLQADLRPHWRNAWRLSVSTICPIHRRLLLDACWCCSAAQFIGGARTVSLGYCEECGRRLRDAPLLPRPRGTSKWRLVEPQRLARSQLPVQLPHPKLWWDGVFVLLNVLGRSRVAAKLLEAQPATTLNPILLRLSRGPRLLFDRQDVSTRYELLGLVDWLTSDWPVRFIRTMRGARVSMSEFSTAEVAVPYWLWSVSKDNLDRKRYRVSAAEVTGAIAALHRSERPVSKIAIKRLLGVTEAKALDAFLPSVRRRLSDTELLMISTTLSGDLTICSPGRDQRAALLRDACSIAAAAWLGTSLTVTSGLKIQDGYKLLDEWQRERHVISARGQLANIFLAWMAEYLRSGRLRFERYDLPQDALFLSRFGVPTQGFGLAARFASLLRRCNVSEWTQGARLLS